MNRSRTFGVLTLILSLVLGPISFVQANDSTIARDDPRIEGWIDPDSGIVQIFLRGEPGKPYALWVGPDLDRPAVLLAAGYFGERGRALTLHLPALRNVTGLGLFLAQPDIGEVGRRLILPMGAGQQTGLPPSPL